jgi:cytochrome c553
MFQYVGPTLNQTDANSVGARKRVEEGFMKKLSWALILAFAIILSIGLSTGAQAPQQAAPPAIPPPPPGMAWAFPAADKDQPPAEANTPKQVPGSSKTYTPSQIDDLFNPPDWFPDEHAPLPSIVEHGIGKTVQACGACHLMSGTGHPESAGLAGLPAGYIIREMGNFKSKARIDPARMNAIALGTPDDDVKAAANWFAELKPKPWFRVVETKTVPKTYINKVRMRLPSAEGGTEPLGNRIIELPEDAARASSRDPHSGFITYVPVGSLKKGEALVKTGGSGKTIQCAICHGESLQGLAEVPRIGGLSALYIGRQLYSIQTGTRAGSWDTLMKGVVAKLSEDDILSISAYLASRSQ